MKRGMAARQRPAYFGRPPHVAWIETSASFSILSALMASPPARGRGLKPPGWNSLCRRAGSPPARGRGLKLDEAVERGTPREAATRAGAEHLLFPEEAEDPAEVAGAAGSSKKVGCEIAPVPNERLYNSARRPREMRRKFRGLPICLPKPRSQQLRRKMARRDQVSAHAPETRSTALRLQPSKTTRNFGCAAERRTGCVRRLAGER